MIDLIIRDLNSHPRASASITYKTIFGNEGHEEVIVESAISNTDAYFSDRVITPFIFSLEGSEPATPPNCYQASVIATADDSSSSAKSNQVCYQGPAQPPSSGGGSADLDPGGSTNNEDIPCFPGDPTCPYSPIIINFDDGGFRLTGGNAPVSFDMAGNGQTHLMGWTAAGADEAFLWLDRNHDGRVTSGAELFGNFTPLRNGQLAKNGFEALAEFDANHDGVIDDHDPMWSQLLLWRDLNHNGISEPNEITRLGESDVMAIDLHDHWAGRHDQWGNAFRYESLISIKNKSGQGVHKQSVYDIFFVTRRGNGFPRVCLQAGRYTSPPHMNIELLRADVSSLKVDAIINPASASKPVADFGPVPVGHAVVTSGGNVLCKFVIHAIVPRNGEGDEDAKLRNAMWAALKRAEELAIASVAMPPVPGPFGFEPGRCSRVLLSTTLDFRPHARSLQRVVFCAFSEDAYGELQRALEELKD